jgi:hypothetical protein
VITNPLTTKLDDARDVIVIPSRYRWGGGDGWDGRVVGLVRRVEERGGRRVVVVGGWRGFSGVGGGGGFGGLEELLERVGKV